MTLIFLLWILTLTSSLTTSVRFYPKLEGVKDYELIQPVRLHTVQKRHSEGSRPETIKYAMTVGGKDIVMFLEKNRHVLTSDYSETYYQDDGTPATTNPTDIDHCYYHGHIVNDSESMVSISTCDGLRGYLKTSAQKYLMEPLSGGDEGDHAVMTFEQQNSKPVVCGVTNTTWSTDFEPPTGKSRSRAAGPSMFQKQKHIELYLVADNREYLKWNGDRDKLRKRIFEVVNFVNLVYKPLNTFIALVGIEVWSSGDLISVTPPAGSTLEAFNKWRTTELKKRHDNAHLISGIDFDGATVGLAYVGTLCSTHSSGVVQDHNAAAIAVGATLAHEMGHNLGMNHDDSSACACSGNSCIMAAALSYDIPRSFSSCSSGNYEHFQTSRNPECLLNMPEIKDLVAPAVCGNGFLEQGEDCDCGTLMECTNPCCNATTCTFTTGSQCAVGECCDNCKILPRSRVCRRKQDNCDLAEYCDGKNSTCPEDVFAVNGLPCDGSQGYCYTGRCPQTEQYPIRCRQADPGIKCGDGKVCSPNLARDSCVDLHVAYRNTNCSANCPGHAVCNHKNNCQCEPGWLPPNCDTKDPSFTTLSTGAVAAISVCALLLVLGVIAFIFKRHQIPILPTVNTHNKQQHTHWQNQRPVFSLSPAGPQKPPIRPMRPVPPPPPAGNRPKPTTHNYLAANQAGPETSMDTESLIFGEGPFSGICYSC